MPFALITRTMPLVARTPLAVLIAQWMATGRGLGNLLNQSRLYPDHGMVPTVVLYRLTYLVERLSAAQ